MSRTPRTVLACATIGLLVAGCGAAESGTAAASGASGADTTASVVTVHRTETCGCCGGYEEALEKHGFEVVQVMYDDAELNDFKVDAGIPQDEWSCHTNEIDGYFVEGHAPLAAIDDLLETQPEIDGIALGGMPTGSPGMPGQKKEPFTVTTIVDGETTGEFGLY